MVLIRREKLLLTVITSKYTHNNESMHQDCEYTLHVLCVLFYAVIKVQCYIIYSHCEFCYSSNKSPIQDSA